MQPTTPNNDYKKVLTDIIQKQMVILGPAIALVKAKNVQGLTVAEDGSVTEISGSPQKLIQSLTSQFVQLSGLIVQKTMEPLLDNYQNTNLPAAPNIDVPPSQAPQPLPQTPPLPSFNTTPPPSSPSSSSLPPLPTENNTVVNPNPTDPNPTNTNY